MLRGIYSLPIADDGINPKGGNSQFHGENWIEISSSDVVAMI